MQHERIQNAILDIQKFADVRKSEQVSPVKRTAALPVFH
jgi:hypothetical protein